MMKFCPFAKRLSQGRKKRKEIAQKRRVFIKTATFIFLGLIALILIYRIFIFFSDTSLSNQNRWTIGLESDRPIIASLNRQEKKIIFLIVPAEVVIGAYGGRGEYRIEAFGRLEQLLKEPFLLQDSLVNSLALPIDGWLKEVDFTNMGLDGKWLKKELQQNLWSHGLKIKGLSRWDRFRFLWQSFLIKNYQTEVIDLAESRCLLKNTFPDGSELVRFDQNCLDDLLGRYFSDEKIRNSGLTIGVANATEYPGLAQEASRMVINTGGTVIKLDEWPQKLDESVILVNSEIENEPLLEQMSKFYGASVARGDMGQFIVNVLLIVGQDYRERFNIN